MVLADHINEIKKLRQSLSRHCRYEYNLGIGHIGQHTADSVRYFIDRLVILFHGIPLIHGDDDCLAALMGNPRYLRILLADAFHRINDQHHDIRPFHRADSPHDHIVLQGFLDLIFPAQACRVYEYIFLSVVDDLRIHGIPGSPGNIRHNEAVFSQQLIDQGRFPHIRLSDNCHPGALILFLFSLCPVKVRDDLLQHIAKSKLIRRGNGMGLPDSQIVELIYIRHVFLETVHLIDHKDYRLAGTPQHVSYLGIRIHQPVLHIYKEHDHIRRLYGDLRLSPHLGQDDISAVRLDSSGINQGKCLVKPGDIRIDPVPGDTRGILDNGYALSRQSIEQGGFPHIRPAHHRHDRFSVFFRHSVLLYS